MNFDPALALSILPSLLRGAGITLGIVAPVLGVGFLLALPVALARMSGREWLSWSAWLFVLFFRGTPALVLLFMIYNGFAVVPAVRGSFLWAVFVDPYYCAVIGFTFNHAAFLSEILRGGLDAVPKSVTEAGRALALSRTQLLFLIRLPLAMRLGLSAYQNEVILLTKGTAAVSAITLMDILGAANEAVATTYDPFTPLICAAAIYWAIVQLLREAFGRIEKHAQRHLRRGDSDRAVPVAPPVPRTA
jgi:His/Glu/Gln/Arg/opine family amino acid ABC transporter permease subunit